MNRRHRDGLTYGRFKTPWPSASGASGAIAPLDAARSNPKSTAAKAFADWRVGSRRRWGSTLLSGGCGHEGDNGATGRLDSIDIQGLAHQAPLLAGADAEGRTMHGLFAAFIVLAMLVGTGEATGAQRTKPTQHSGSNAVVQTEAPQRGASSRRTRSNRATGMSPTFRAEDIVPDICKGCSS
jgi:hypothetical protein